MPKFLTGFTVGVFTGWLFHDAISQNLRKAVDYGNEKVDDVKETVDDVKESVKNEVDFNLASYDFPALGADLPFERIVEINAATIDSPVTVTYEEMTKMSHRHSMVALGKGRLKLEERS